MMTEKRLKEIISEAVQDAILESGMSQKERDNKKEMLLTSIMF